MNEAGDFGYTSMGEQANSDRTVHKAAERENSKAGPMSRKVKTLFQSIRIPRSRISKKVERLLKSRPKFLEPFMKAYVDSKSYLSPAKNAQVDGLAVPDTSSVTEAKTSSEPSNDETEADDWGSGEPSTIDWQNEQQRDDGSTAADFESRGHTLDGEIKSNPLLYFNKFIFKS